MAAIDGTPEGLAAAAAVREAAQKKRHAEAGQGPAADLAPAAKKLLFSRPPPSCTHEVAIPASYDPSAVKFEEALHGGSHSG